MAEKAALIIDGPGSGSWNMALDRALLEQAASSQMITVRIYGWEPATVSLGYFQSNRDRARHAPSIGCPFVRRATGGGAIVHDHELTYSISMPADGRRSSVSSNLYRRVHQTLISVLESHGITGCAFHDGCATAKNESESIPDKQAFLCFLRRSPGDVVLNGFKVIGSAQRRYGGALLQHGSLLLSRSAAAPELPGINELAGREVSRAITVADFVDRWPEVLQAGFGWQFEDSRPPDELRVRALAIEKEVFGSTVWNEKR